jgi:hypothetical protein
MLCFLYIRTSDRLYGGLAGLHKKTSKFHTRDENELRGARLYPIPCAILQYRNFTLLRDVILLLLVY